MKELAACRGTGAGIWRLTCAPHARRVQYKLKDYLVAATVSGGCALFLLTGSVSSSAARNQDKSTSMMGVAMMLGYLLFDGLTSSWQERLFKKSNVGHVSPSHCLSLSLCLSLFLSLPLSLFPSLPLS